MCTQRFCLLWLQPSAPLAFLQGHQGPVRCLCWAPAGSSLPAGQTASAMPAGRSAPILFTGSDDWSVRIWDATMGQCMGTCIGHGGPITTVQVKIKHIYHITCACQPGMLAKLAVVLCCVSASSRPSSLPVWVHIPRWWHSYQSSRQASPRHQCRMPFLLIHTGYL